VILKEFSQVWRYRRTYLSCKIENYNFGKNLFVDDQIRFLCYQRRARERVFIYLSSFARDSMRERENSVFVYHNKQASAKTRWVRYIAVNY